MNWHLESWRLDHSAASRHAHQPRQAFLPGSHLTKSYFTNPASIDLSVSRDWLADALKFNGKDQYVEMSGFDVGEDDFSIELWIRTLDSLHTPSIVDKRDRRPLGYLIFIYQGHPGFQVANEDLVDAALAKSVNIADNRWHHVAGVCKRLPPERLGVYVDGVKQPDVSMRNAPLVNLDVPVPLWLGRHHANKLVARDDIYFEGEIDELSFYHRALTAAEIQLIFRAGSRGKCRPGR